jgi:hypothetical protein
VRFARNDCPYAAPWIAHVAAAAGYQMDMTVIDCLARNSSDIYANIEPFYRRISGDNIRAKSPQKRVDSNNLYNG